MQTEQLNSLITTIVQSIMAALIPILTADNRQGNMTASCYNATLKNEGVAPLHRAPFVGRDQRGGCKELIRSILRSNGAIASQVRQSQVKNGMTSRQILEHARQSDLNRGYAETTIRMHLSRFMKNEIGSVDLTLTEKTERRGAFGQKKYFLKA